MARKTTEKRLQDVHCRALTQFSDIMGTMRAERDLCLSDRRFYSIAGAQWEGVLSQQFENRPQFEFNKIHLAVIRIISEYRNNRMSVRFVPKDGEKPDGSCDDITSIYRSDMDDGGESKDNAFEEAVGGGFGAYRLRNVEENEYSDEDEKQKIIVEPIFDADSSVFFDLSAKRQDKADAEYAYVLTGIQWDAYKDKYGDDPTTWPKDVSCEMFDWSVTNDVVYIAEYYEKEKKTETLHVFRGVDGTEQTYTDRDLEDEELVEFLQATGFTEARTRKRKTCKVKKYILSGGGVLEDCGYIAGKNIPIVPVYGKRWVVDGVERCMGHVRLAKDAQRLKNLQLSKLGEIAALSSVQKPVFTPEQVSGHEVMWAEDNVKQYPFLLTNPIRDANGNPMLVGAQSYTKPPDIPPALAALLQTTEADIRDILGNQEQAEIVSPNVSGVALELAQSKMDMQTFIYVSNFAKAEKRCGEIWLSMAKDVYVEEKRKLRGLSDNDDISSVMINVQSMNPDTGAVTYKNDFSAADFDCIVDVVPASVSRRASAVRALTQMIGMTSDPETQQVLSATAMMNMDAEGVGEIRGYFRKKLLAIGAVEPTKEEAEQMMMQQQMQQQQPDVQAMYFAAEAERAQALAAKARADTVLTMTKVDQTRAETSETLADTAKTRAETRSQIGKDYAQVLSRLEESEGVDLLVPSPKKEEQIAATTQPQLLGEFNGVTPNER